MLAIRTAIVAATTIQELQDQTENNTLVGKLLPKKLALNAFGSAGDQILFVRTATSNQHSILFEKAAI